ncbi:PqqD family protein [Tropicimonas sp. TH_r6]|uniref:PqqD family protein n=1 Tax=Tropicimonas sp. TH_r6 TaxID=3082085 RepID=UPI0029544765|nr:PqqD family protein [Tropicimonas sp. TH_r6]MDV7141322.1 PqqD family protein [Tropicimonas sp. TH_r6]
MTQSIDMTAIYSTSSEAMSSTLGGETILLHLASGTYFGMDAVGTLVWKLLGEELTPKEICARVTEEFENVPDQVSDDILAFLEQLAAQDLIAPV